MANWAIDGFRCATGYDRPNAAVRLRVIYVVHDPETQYWKIGQTVEHDRPVLARIAEQAGERPWRIVGLAIGVRPYRPHGRIASAVPNLDDDLRSAMVDLGCATNVREPGRGTGLMGREWVALRVDIPTALRFLETECWRRGHAWLEPFTTTPSSRPRAATSPAVRLDAHAASVPTARDNQFAAASDDSSSIFTSGEVPYDQFRSGKSMQPVAHRTARGPAVAIGDGTRTAYPGQMAGQKDPVLAFVRFRNRTMTSQPFQLGEAEITKIRKARTRQQEKWQETQSQWESQSQVDALDDSDGSDGSDGFDGFGGSEAYAGDKRPLAAISDAQVPVSFSRQQLRFAGCDVLEPTEDTLVNGSLVFVPESSRYQFTPDCNQAFLTFAKKLPINLVFTRQRRFGPGTCNGYFGVVVNLEHKGNDIVTFDLVWGRGPDQNFPYTTSTRRIRHIGCVSPEDADTLAAAAAAPPPANPGTTSDQDTVRRRKSTDSQEWFRLRLRLRPT